MFPALDDFLSADYTEIDTKGKDQEHDYTKDYLSQEEWDKLSTDQRDQLALDRYIASRKKSNWQIGRDYELSVAHQYMAKGYQVDLFGSTKKLEDLGRDLIATKDGKTLIIQCKYWSQSKTIHEKHIFQLYGTTVCYQLEDNSLFKKDVHPLFITNTKLSPTAKAVADYLGVSFREYYPFQEFPRIKCNVNRDEYGKTHIYHLPMDAQYDIVQITKSDECYATTVSEAKSKGFRRAYRWHGDRN